MVSIAYSALVAANLTCVDNCADSLGRQTLYRQLRGQKLTIIVLCYQDL